jgi:hypothetical protein
MNECNIHGVLLESGKFMSSWERRLRRSLPAEPRQATIASWQICGGVELARLMEEVRADIDPSWRTSTAGQR